MKSGRISLVLLLSVFAVIVIGCKPSVKNEINKYGHNVDAVKKFMIKYPAFKTQIDELSQSAAKIMAEAKALKDIEKKAEKMAKANDVFEDSDFFGQINSYDGRLARIYELQSKVRGRASLRKYSSYKSQMLDAVASSEKSIQDAARIMTDAKPTDQKSAFEEAKKANEILISTEGSLGRAKKLGKKKKR